MNPILIDDTKDPSIVSYETFVTDLQAIAKYRITRNSSYRWAQNLRYLTYDEDDDDNDDDVTELETNEKGKQRAYEPLETHRNQSSTYHRPASTDEHVSISTGNNDVVRSLDDVPGPSSWKSANSNGSDNQLLAETKVSGEDLVAPTVQADPIVLDEAQNDNCYNSDDEEAMLDYAIAMSLAEDGDNQDILKVSEIEQSQDDSEHIHQNKSSEKEDNRSCDLCLSRPCFPSRKRCTKFKVVQFGTPDGHGKRPCQHYIAVSYCWPKDEQGNPLPVQSTYTVKEVGADGIEIERPARAPDEVIDRAVGLARSQGIRLIWIDQECLPQDSSEEQATGIQAMDMVYQQAVVSVGLIGDVVVTQTQLDAIASVLYWQTTGKKHLTWPTPGITFKMVCEHLMSFMRAFGSDQFHTRAWILQEMFSAGRRAVLFIKLENGALWRGPPNVLELSQFRIPGVFNILVEDVQVLIAAAGNFLLETFRLSSEGGIIAWTGSSDTFVGESMRILEDMELFHPRHAQATHFSSYVHVRGGTAYGPRKVCNAATALTFLNTRFNSLPRDRLAIMANLCDYEVRLDLLEIDIRFKSLTTCLYALAILNGDLSLLIPDVYKAKPRQDSKIPSWSVDIHSLIPHIRTTSLKPGLSISLRNANRYSLQDSNLSLPGYLWTVDRFMDMTPIQMQFKERWDRWKCYKLSFGHRNGESREDFQRRVLKVQEAIRSAGSISDEVKKELDIQEVPWEEFGHTNKHSNDSQSNPSDDPVSIAVTRFLSAERIDNDPGVRFMIGYIIFQILLVLHAFLGETELANSIWHSVRTDATSESPKKKSSETNSGKDLPDDVATLFKDNWGDLSQRMWDVLKLDRSETGTFFQIWLIERIMQHGGFWVGRYNRPIVPWKKDAEAEARAEAGVLTRVEGSERPNESKIMRSQLTKQLLASMMLVQKGEMESSDAFDGINFGAMVSFAYMSSVNLWGVRAEDERARRVSVFDVDGPCDVFTPYDADVERLPRPEYRSMKVCWVVEKIADGSGGDEEEINTDSSSPCTLPTDPKALFLESTNEQPREQAKDHHSLESELTKSSTQSKNMKGDLLMTRTSEADTTPLDTQTANEGNKSELISPVPHKDKAEIVSGKNENGVDKEAKSGSAASVSTGKFRVVGRVRGAWECMDEPLGMYTFV